MKIKSNTFERNNEFLLKHPALWKENETNLICNTSIDNLNFKHKSKSIRLNIVVENHIFCVEEMLMECENLFTTVVCTSHDATVLSLKFDDITKLISFNDANKRLNEYCYNILTLFSENLEKCINLEEVNYIISNNNRESIPKDKSFEDINYKIYLSEEYQFYKSLKDQNIISTVKETVQRFSPKNRVNSPTLFYRQICLDGDRRQSCVTPKPLNTQKQFLLPDLKDEMIPKKPLSKYPKFGHRGSSCIKTVRMIKRNSQRQILKEEKPRLSLVPANFMYNSVNRLKNYHKVVFTSEGCRTVKTAIRINKNIQESNKNAKEEMMFRKRNNVKS